MLIAFFMPILGEEMEYRDCISSDRKILEKRPTAVVNWPLGPVSSRGMGPST